MAKVFLGSVEGNLNVKATLSSGISEKGRKWFSLQLDPVTIDGKRFAFPAVFANSTEQLADLSTFGGFGEKSPEGEEIAALD